jgi:hypothetical protein
VREAFQGDRYDDTATTTVGECVVLATLPLAMLVGGCGTDPIIEANATTICGNLDRGTTGNIFIGIQQPPALMNNTDVDKLVRTSKNCGKRWMSSVLSPGTYICGSFNRWPAS